MKSSREPQELLQHLNELRWCMIRAAMAWAVMTMIGFIYARSIIQSLTSSVGELVVLGVTEALATQLKVGATAGAVMAAPVALLEIWRFAAPGLTTKERHALLPLLPMMIIMPLIGGAFSLYIILPQVVGLLKTFGGGEWRLFLSLGQFVSFALGITWPMALAFETPVLIYFGARLGWLNSRTLLKRWRLMVLMAFASAAVLSPGPDVMLQILLVVPLLFLYGVCIVVARLADGHQRHVTEERRNEMVP